MKKIKDVLHIRRFDYKLIKRTDKTALYELSVRNIIYGYEIHKIRLFPVSDKIIHKKGERMAFTNEFGKYAWSYQDLNLALTKFEEVDL